MEREMKRALGHYGRILKGDGGGQGSKTVSKSAKKPFDFAPTSSKKSHNPETATRAPVTKTSGAVSSLPFKQASSTPRKVERIRFVDPHHRRGPAAPIENRKQFLSSKVSDLYREQNDDSDDDDIFGGGSSRRKRKRPTDDDEFDFDAACGDIRTLVNNAGGTKDIEKRYGFAKPTKPVKMPYKMMMRVNKYHDVQEKERTELMKLSGVGLTNKSKPKRERQRAQPPGRGRWKEVIRPLNASVGRFHKGTQHIKPAEIDRINKRGRGRGRGRGRR